MRRHPDSEAELSQAVLFELLKKLTLRPCAEDGLAFELVCAETSDGVAIPVARGFGDTALHALSDIAINIAADDPFGELDTFVAPGADEGGAEPDAGP